MKTNHGFKILAIILGSFFLLAFIGIKIDQWMGWEKARNERKMRFQLACFPSLATGGFAPDLHFELDTHNLDTDSNHQEDARRESEKDHNTTTSTDHNGREHIYIDGAELA